MTDIVAISMIIIMVVALALGMLFFGSLFVFWLKDLLLRLGGHPWKTVEATSSTMGGTGLTYHPGIGPHGHRLTSRTNRNAIELRRYDEFGKFWRRTQRRMGARFELTITVNLTIPEALHIDNTQQNISSINQLIPEAILTSHPETYASLQEHLSESPAKVTRISERQIQLWMPTTDWNNPAQITALLATGGELANAITNHIRQPWDQLAAKHNLDISLNPETGHFSLRGHITGVPIDVQSEEDPVTRGATQQTTHIHATLDLEELGFSDLRIRARKGGETGGIQTGQPIFDRVLMVTGNPTDRIKQLLMPAELCESFLAIFGQFPDSLFANGELRLTANELLVSNLVTEVEGVSSLILKLRDRIEQINAQATTTQHLPLRQGQS